MSSPPRRKIGSRACDGCKIRKVKCFFSEGAPPCTRCASISIECTFNKRQATRGPRSLRAKTMADIRSLQERESQGQSQAFSSSTSPTSGGDPAERSRSHRAQETHGKNPGAAERGRTPVSSLIVRLCLYNQRLFPVWPILAVEDVIASLLRDPVDLETYALANAVCAAIIAQLKLPFEGRTDDNDPASAASMAAECQRTKASLLQKPDDGEDDDKSVSLNMLRISFFQHIYHENLRPGGSKSLLFLREAITTAQIMGLHRRSHYAALPTVEEQQMRRRILWLLFVTERGVAMLHRLPTVLVWQPGFPALDRGASGVGCEQLSDEAHILPAFRKLVELFWVFDQGGAFDLIHADDGGDAYRSGRLEVLQRRLQSMSEGEHEVNEVQRADILVTRSWMQTVLWRASIRPSRASATSMVHSQAVASTSLVVQQPYSIVHDFLTAISRYSKTALEAHGPTIELKIYEIASALTDALAANLALLRSSVGMLIQLQRLLASSRGGNKPLLTLLCARIAEVEKNNGIGSPDSLPASPPLPEADGDGKDEEDIGGAFQTAGRTITRRRTPPYPTYLDAMRLDYPLLPMWPEPNPGDGGRNVEPCGDLEIMFTHLTNESWNDWAVDLSQTLL